MDSQQSYNIKVTTVGNQFSGTREDHSLLKILGVILISSLIPLLVLFYQLYLIKRYPDMELGALALVYLGVLITPVVIIISLASYFLAKKLLKVSRMSHLFLIAPLFLSIISPNFLFILSTSTAYIVYLKYKSFNPEVRLLEDNFSERRDPELFLADYYYRLNISNPTNKTYKYINVSVNLTDKTKDFGADIQNREILSGNNVIEGKILVDSHAFKSGYTLKDKLFLRITYSFPGKLPAQFLEVSGQNHAKFQEILQNFKRGQQVINTPLPATPPEIIAKASAAPNWKKYQGKEVSFFYPPEWREDFTSDSSTVFYSTIPGLLDEFNIFRYSKGKSSLMDRLETWRKIAGKNFVETNLQVAGHDGIKLDYLTSESITVILQAGENIHELHIQYLPKQEAEKILNQILATIEFIKSSP